MKKITTFIVLSSLAALSIAQRPADRKDKATFISGKPGYYQNNIMKDITNFKESKAEAKPHKIFRMSMEGVDVPTSVKEFKTIWKQTPISQGNTSTCWCFSSTSFYESEIKRISGKEVNLSELYTVYWEFIAKAKEFVRTRGTSNFEEGSEANAVVRNFKEYGVVPETDYTGRPNGEPFHNHADMFKEMKGYLNSVKANNAWNDAEVISTIKSILNHYIGEPPTHITVDKKKMTPQEYLKNYLKLNMDDYIDVMSLMEQPYWATSEYAVPDNWWHAQNYYNVPLDTFMSILDRSVKSGYGVMIGGDVSEPGYNAIPNVVMIPSFDIPSSYIDENARQFRFSNGTTTDDHGMHICGWAKRASGTWYLVKDSGAGSRNCGVESENFGYYFMHEDYVKLKMMDFVVHKDMLKNILGKFKH